MRNFSKREWKIFAICVTIIIIWMGKILPQFFFFDKSKQGIEIEKKEIELKNLHKIIKDKEVIKRKYDRYEKKIKNKGGINTFIQQIEKISNQSNLKITNIKPLSEKKDDFCKQNLVSINAKAGIVDLAHFIYLLIDCPEITRIKKIEISREFKKEILEIGILFSNETFY